MIQEASERIEIIPAEYETVEQTVVVKDATQRITTVPAAFGTDSEQVEVSPASTSWVNVAVNRYLQVRRRSMALRVPGWIWLALLPVPVFASIIRLPSLKPSRNKSW